MLDRRRAGVLLHITSLPDSSGVSGTLGEEACRFVDFLAAARISVWQTLPLGPTHSDRSPYQCLSSHAGNPKLISLDWLVDKGWLARPDNPGPWSSSADDHDHCLQEAYAGFQRAARRTERRDYQAFVTAHAGWLDDFACYMALRRQFENQAWQAWPAPFRNRQPAALEQAKVDLKDDIEQSKFEQFVFFSQWNELRSYAHEHGVALFGDLPIFVAGDSADVGRAGLFRIG